MYAYGSDRKKLVYVAIPFVSRPCVFRVTMRLMMAITIRKRCNRYKVDIKYFARVLYAGLTHNPKDISVLNRTMQPYK